MKVSVALDIGHSSIGWAVIDSSSQTPTVHGCGTVVFPAEDCQNQQRAGFRRQRRNIAATRNRISRLEGYLQHIGALGSADIERARERPHPWPWLLSARCLRTGESLSWPELWQVMRWYAHNRGYDGNALWARDQSGNDEDVERVQKARQLMDEHETSSMAETVCAVLGVDPTNERNPKLEFYFKGLNAAFPRSSVENEVSQLLEIHRPILRELSNESQEAILNDWQIAEKQGFRTKLPQRYHGGLLFGQLKPRFDNRIIPRCRITGEKTPNKHSRDFYHYRWAMFVNNLTVDTNIGDTGRKLTASERQHLTKIIETTGFFTEATLKKALEDSLGLSPANLEATLMMPEMEKALTFDPALKEVNGKRLEKIWKTIPKSWQRVFANQLFHERKFRGSSPSLHQWRKRMTGDGIDVSSFDEAVDQAFSKEFKHLERKGKHTGFNVEEFLTRPIVLNAKATGRAPYSRLKMREATECVYRGEEPRAVGGPLEETEDVRRRAIEQPLDQATNNHLVRHRLKILRRLLDDLCETYCEGDAERIESVSVEVVRDLVEFSGKTAKEKEAIQSSKLAHHRKVVKLLEEAQKDAGASWRINPGLIKKARIADELGWTCPYTGRMYSISDIIHKRVDKEHIIPRSQRPTDALDALVLTFPEINRLKGARTAWQFVHDEQNSEQIMTLTQFEDFVRKLKSRGPSKDDKLRCNRRKAALLTKHIIADSRNEETETEDAGISGFTEGALSQTSYLNKLAAIEVQKWAAQNIHDSTREPTILHLSGSVTAAARRAWKIESTLEEARPFVRDTTKTQKRELTHLHHAVDAVAIALAGYYFPKDGRLWRLLSRRRIGRSEDQAYIKRILGEMVSFSVDGAWSIKELNSEVRQSAVRAMQEKRVVRHQPRTFRGLMVEENTCRVLGSVEDDPLRKYIRRNGRIERERESKLLGTSPKTEDGKLASLKGALVVRSNFGLALDPEIRVVSYQRVWEQLNELKAKNRGRYVRIIRQGDLIRVNKGRYLGEWRVVSIKDAKQECKLDIAEADVVQLKSGVSWSRREVLFRTLLNNGLTVVKRNYVGENLD